MSERNGARSVFGWAGTRPAATQSPVCRYVRKTTSAAGNRFYRPGGNNGRKAGRKKHLVNKILTVVIGQGLGGTDNLVEIRVLREKGRADAAREGAMWPVHRADRAEGASRARKASTGCDIAVGGTRLGHETGRGGCPPARLQTARHSLRSLSEVVAGRAGHGNAPSTRTLYTHL